MSAPFSQKAFAEIVRDAASRIRTAFDDPIAVERKGDGSPVTATDRAVDAFLHEALGRLVPDAGWLSEESADEPSRLTRELVWIVDPIDGTKQFVRHIPELAVSVALARGSRPIAAAVINPVSGEEGFWTLGRTPEFYGLDRAASPASLDAAVAIVSRSEMEAGDLAGCDGIVGSLRPVGSVAYKLLRIAAGADAVTFSVRPKSEWDVCAGAALVAAGGGVYLRLDGRPVLFNQPVPEIASGAVAGPDALTRTLRDRLRARGR